MTRRLVLPGGDRLRNTDSERPPGTGSGSPPPEK